MNFADSGAVVAGDLLDGGRYELERKLGEGTFGDVWQASHKRFQDKKVAIKFLKQEHVTRPEIVERFQREAEALASVNHPNIIKVEDRGSHKGLSYFVMEYVAGVTLRNWLDNFRPNNSLPPVDDVRRIFLEVCDGLAAAHGAGIVHRDLKPDNIMLRGGSGRPVVIDFGIARVGARSARSRTGFVAGTPEYMAPEQATGQAGRIGKPVDVFSLAVIVLEMLTLSFAPDDTGIAWWARVLLQGPTDQDLLARCKGLPVAAIPVLCKALAQDPADRPADAGTFGAALRAVWRENGALPEGTATAVAIFHQGVPPTLPITENIAPLGPGGTQLDPTGPKAAPEALEDALQSLDLDQIQEGTREVESLISAQPERLREFEALLVRAYRCIRNSGRPPTRATREGCTVRRLLLDRVEPAERRLLREELAVLDEHFGDYEAARRDWAEVFKAKPDERSWNELVRLSEPDKWKTARGALDAAFKLHPGRSDALRKWEARLPPTDRVARRIPPVPPLSESRGGPNRPRSARMLAAALVIIGIGVALYAACGSDSSAGSSGAPDTSGQATP